MGVDSEVTALPDNLALDEFGTNLGESC